MSQPATSKPYTPVWQRLFKTSRLHITTTTEYILKSETFTTLHRKTCPASIDPQDLLLCLTVLLAGFLLIDPFGINGALLRILLWLVPLGITCVVLRGEYTVALQVEKEPLQSPDFVRRILGSKWMDYWLTSIGLRIAEKGTRGTSMLFLQIGLLLWWIIGNDTAPARPTVSSTSAGMGEADNALVETETTSGEEGPTESLPTSPRSTAPKRDTPSSGELSDASSIATKIQSPLSPSTPPNASAQKHKATSTAVPGPIKQPNTLLERGSLLSPSSEGTIPFDGDSVYSSSFEYDTEGSAASPSLMNGEIGKAPPLSTTAVRRKDPVEEMELPPLVNVGGTSAAVKKETSVAKVLPIANIDALGTMKTNDVPDKSAQPAPQLPPRTSRILAQLDDLLVTEMEGVSPQSPIAKSSTKSKSDALNLETPLEVRRLVAEADQRRQQGRKRAGESAKQAADAVDRPAARKETHKKTELDQQLDALIDTRMSDLFSTSDASDVRAKGEDGERLVELGREEFEKMKQRDQIRIPR